MQKRNFKFFVVVLALGLSSIASPVKADAWDARGCVMGNQVTSGVSLSIDGFPIAGPTGANSNEFANGYVVNVCNDTANRSYIIYVSNPNNPRNYLYDSDATRTFTVSFTPAASDVPQIVEGHARIQSFAIDSAAGNKVTVSMKPINWSDLGNDKCNGAGPVECSKIASTASEDFANDIRVGVRYGTEFGILQGMTWSAGAYYFGMSTACPALNAGAKDGLSFEMGGPHFKADGITVNSGFATVFIPNAAIKKCFGGTAADFVAKAMLTRTEGADKQIADTSGNQGTGLYYTLSASADGLTIDIPTVTFSQPTYKLSKARAVKTKAAIVKSSRIKQKRGGSVSILVKSPKYCAANASTVYGIKKGTCKVSVVSYLPNGKKYRSTTYSFKVK